MVLATVACTIAWGSTERVGAGSQLQQPARTATPEYRIGAGDVIEVQVEKAAELSGTFVVGSDGSIPNRFLGPIQARGKTAEELSRVIADGLRGRYLVHPFVTVTVRQANSRTFLIQGAVRSPGSYQITERPSLARLILEAGGLAVNHGSTAVILRPKGGSGAFTVDSGARPAAASSQADRDYDVLHASIEGLFLGRRLEENLVLEPGDIVTVPQADVFYVSGEVRAPGSFTFKEGMTLRRAISLAQGTTGSASKDSCTIHRVDPMSGRPGEIRVDLGAIISGRKPDIPLMANDIVHVSSSKFKSFGAALLRAFSIGIVRIPPYRY